MAAIRIIDSEVKRWEKATSALSAEKYLPEAMAKHERKSPEKKPALKRTARTARRKQKSESESGDFGNSY